MARIAGRPTLLLLIAAVFTGATAQAQTVDEAARAALQKVIAGQLQAFRQDDAEAAFSHAAPRIKARFRSTARFMAMVRQLYPPVYRHRAVRFGKLRLIRGKPVQEVMLVGTDRQLYLALYQMQRQKSGAWKIAGVLLFRAKGNSL